MLVLGLRVARQDGPQALLQGAGATFGGYFMHGALKYGLFELWKGALRVGRFTLAMRVPLLCVSAFLAELVATVVLCPAEVVRVQLVNDPFYASRTLRAYRRLRRRRGWAFGDPFVAAMAPTFIALRQLRRDEGIWEGWFGGLVPLLVKQCLYTVAKLVTYDVGASLLASHLPGDLRFLGRALAALAAAAAATVASQPGDTLFTCVSTEGGECPFPTGDLDTWPEDDQEETMWAEMCQTARRLGLRGLFLGWRARVCQMSFIVVLQLLLYDYLRPT